MNIRAFACIACAVLMLASWAFAQATPPAQVPPERGQKIFQKADANNDGKLSYEEITALRPQFPRARFDALDTNKDGVLTRDEFAAIRRGNGPMAPASTRAAGASSSVGPGNLAGPGPNGNARQQRMRQLFIEADANKDGKLTFDEIKAVRPGFTQERFKRMDRNGDGVLSKEDRAAPPQS